MHTQILADAEVAINVFHWIENRAISANLWSYSLMFFSANIGYFRNVIFLSKMHEKNDFLWIDCNTLSIALLLVRTSRRVKKNMLNFIHELLIWQHYNQVYQAHTTQCSKKNSLNCIQMWNHSIYSIRTVVCVYLEL